jgi:hypothetical protein
MAWLASQAQTSLTIKVFLNYFFYSISKYNLVIIITMVDISAGYFFFLL